MMHEPELDIHDIARICHPGDTQIFTLSEARALLPLVNRITTNAVMELSPMQKRLGRMLACDPRIKVVEREYEAIVRRWIGKIERLGLVASGLWWVSYDIGEGYVCWRYPEIRLDYFRNYGERPEDRRKISEICEQYCPDWIF
jgi:hypothetical protein